MSTLDFDPTKKFLLDFEPAFESAFDIENPQTPVSTATSLAIVVQGPSLFADHPRYVEEFDGYLFTYTRDEESSEFPINRLAVYTFIEQVLTHINVDAFSVEEYGDHWLEHCWVNSAFCIQVEDTLYIFPNFSA